MCKYYSLDIKDALDTPNWLLLLQGWTALWLIIGNTFVNNTNSGPIWENGLVKTAYSFNMALFVFVCGCHFPILKFPDNSDLGFFNLKVIFKNILGLLIPFIVFTFCAIFIKTMLIGHEGNYWVFVSSEIMHSFLFPSEKPLATIWMLLVILWFYLLAPLWNVAVRHHWSSWLIICFLIILHYLRPMTDFLCIGWTFYFAIFFFIGIYIKRYNFLNNISTSVSIIVFLLGYVIYLYGVDFDSLMTEFGGICFSVLLCYFIGQSFPKFFCSFRTYFLQILLMGYFAQILLKLTNIQQLLPYVLSYVLFVFVGIYIPVLIVKCVECFKQPLLNYCLGIGGAR